MLDMCVSAYPYGCRSFIPKINNLQNIIKIIISLNNRFVRLRMSIIIMCAYIFDLLSDCKNMPNANTKYLYQKILLVNELEIPKLLRNIIP